MIKRWNETDWKPLAKGVAVRIIRYYHDEKLINTVRQIEPI